MTEWADTDCLLLSLLFPFLSLRTPLALVIWPGRASEFREVMHCDVLSARTNNFLLDSLQKHSAEMGQIQMRRFFQSYFETVIYFSL